MLDMRKDEIIDIIFTLIKKYKNIAVQMAYGFSIKYVIRVPNYCFDNYLFTSVAIWTVMV